MDHPVQSAASRRPTYLIWLLLAVPGAMFGLGLPFHDYAGLGDRLEETVSNDGLLFSAFIAGVAALIAMVPLAMRPPRWTRAFALTVLGLALFNLVRVLSYYSWRSDLVVCTGGRC